MDRWGCYSSRHTYTAALSCLIRPLLRSSLVPLLKKTCITKLHVFCYSECHGSVVSNKEILSRGISLFVLNCTKQSDSSIFAHETHARQHSLFWQAVQICMSKLSKGELEWIQRIFTETGASVTSPWQLQQNRERDVDANQSQSVHAHVVLRGGRIGQNNWKHLCGWIMAVKGLWKEISAKKLGHSFMRFILF